MTTEKYEIVEDVGKPDTITVNGVEALRAELRRFYLLIQNGDYAHADMTIYNANGEDISESQFIREMIEDIIGGEQP